MIIYIHALLNPELRTKLKTTLSDEHTLLFRTEDTSDKQAADFFHQATYILGNPPRTWFQSAPPQLKYWQLESAGFDQYKDIRLPADVMTANMGDWYARPCAETIVAGILAVYRGIDRLAVLKTKREWIGEGLRTQLRLLNKKTVVVLGAGSIGMATKQILTGFGCRILVMARTSPKAELHSQEQLFEALRTTDIVINTLPGSAHHFVNAEFLKHMKSGSVYANVGRGSTTDEPALIEALQSKHLSGAVLDVTETEPLPDGSPLWNFDNVVLMQHTGGGHVDEHDGKADLFIRNIQALQEGRTIENEVQLDKGY